MEHITLFTDILPEEQERMRICFHAREMTFRNGETIMEYSSSMKKIGLILYGRAILYCCDTEGNQYLIDEFNKDAVFGEPFLLPADSQHYYVCAAEPMMVKNGVQAICSIWFTSLVNWERYSPLSCL